MTYQQIVTRTETDVRAFIGKPETTWLEFKSGGIFGKPEEERTIELCKQVSAFANTDGGELILGVNEKKRGNAKVAVEIDGVSTTLELQQLRQKILDNIRPDGLIFHLQSVAVADPTGDKLVICILVPKGATAYQVGFQDRRYYGRSDDEVKPLLDHEVRARMLSHRAPQARVDFADWNCLTVDAEFDARQTAVEEAKHALESAIEATQRTTSKRFILRSDQRRNLEQRLQIAEAALKTGKRDFNEYSFSLRITNIGETTIRDFLCVIRNSYCDSIYCDGEAIPIDAEISARFAVSQVSETLLEPDYGSGSRRKHLIHPAAKLFPHEATALQFGRLSLRLQASNCAAENWPTLPWKVFLDDAPPSEGILSLDPAQAISG